MKERKKCTILYCASSLGDDWIYQELETNRQEEGWKWL